MQRSPDLSHVYIFEIKVQVATVLRASDLSIKKVSHSRDMNIYIAAIESVTTTDVLHTTTTPSRVPHEVSAQDNCAKPGLHIDETYNSSYERSIPKRQLAVQPNEVTYSEKKDTTSTWKII